MAFPFLISHSTFSMQKQIPKCTAHLLIREMGRGKEEVKALEKSANAVTKKPDQRTTRIQHTQKGLHVRIEQCGYFCIPTAKLIISLGKLLLMPQFKT